MREKEILMRRLVIMTGIVLSAGLAFLPRRRRPDLRGGRQMPGLPPDRKAGKQFPLWEAGKHAQSFNNLKAETAKTESGEQIPAQSPRSA